MRIELAFLAGLALGGCNQRGVEARDAGARDLSLPSSPQSANLGPSLGGTIASADGRVRVDFPAGAVAQPTTVSIRATVASETRPGSVPAGVAYVLSPDGLALASPATVTVTFTDAELHSGTPGLNGPVDGADVPLPALLTQGAAGPVVPVADQVLDGTASPYVVTGTVRQIATLWSVWSTSGVSGIDPVSENPGPTATTLLPFFVQQLAQESITLEEFTVTAPADATITITNASPGMVLPAGLNALVLHVTCNLASSVAAAYGVRLAVAYHGGSLDGAKLGYVGQGQVTCQAAALPPPDLAPPGPCAAVGAACLSDSDCCQDHVAASRCNAPSAGAQGRCCVGSGGICKVYGDCCSGACMSGGCY
jgi:hypothetical protein